MPLRSSPTCWNSPPRQTSSSDGRAGMGKSNVEFHVFGVAVLVNELFSAIDLSLHRNKLWITGGAALIWAVGSWHSI